MVKVYLNKAWNYNPAGRTLSLGAGQAELLIARGVGVAVDDKPAMDGAPDDRGEVRRKPGRPRKVVHEEVR